MYKLIILSVAVAAVSAVTPFFESPHNEKAAAFYKKPAYSAPGPIYKPIYKPESYKPAYKPEPYKPAYKPEPYKPAYKPEPSYYKPSYKAPEYKSDYSHGATSYQNVKLEVGEQIYKPTEYKHEYKPEYKHEYKPEYKPHY